MQRKGDRMYKRATAFILSCIMCLSFVGCTDESTQKIDNESGKIEALKYDFQEFELCGLWAPHDITEEAFKLYKDAGFNVCSFTNHDETPRNTDTQYFIGSNRTLEALEICKKVGLDVYIAYGASWFNIANEGEEYFYNKPFTTHDQYAKYKDIIKGVHINDEPNKETMTKLSDDALIEDFKKAFPNTKYMINLIPETAITSRNYENYTEMLEHYGNDIMSKFDNPYICVDCYLCSNWNMVGANIVNNYNQIANTAKKYNAETSFILQSSTGNEFWEEVTEADMRQQAYLALAFGADNLQYYCYSVPTTYNTDGTVESYLYNNCMLNQDRTPSQLYYDVKTVNTEIQSFASAILAYDWQQSVGVSGIEKQTHRIGCIELDDNWERVKFKDAKHYVEAIGTHDLVISRFTSDRYGESYMFVNFAEPSKETPEINKVEATFKDCRAVAVYGGEGYTGTPEIIELDDKGLLKLEFAYGEGAFIVPIK